MDAEFVSQFTDGCDVEMSHDQAKEAMQLFEAQVDQLVVKAKMPRADASNIGVHTAAACSSKATTRRPILAEGEEKNTEEYESIFEEEYDGDVPKLLVGLEFPKRFFRWYSEKEQEEIWLPFWQYVLRKLAEKLLVEGVSSSRDLLNLEKAEEKKMSN